MDLIESKISNYKSSTRHPWELSRLKFIKKIIRNFLTKNPNPNILDIGCGDIFFLSELAKEYPMGKFYGIDTAFSPMIIEDLKHQYPEINRTIFLFDDVKKLKAEHIDFLLLMDIIEHIENDQDFLSEILYLKNITNDTYFLITVPAFQTLFSSHDTFLKHYRRYNLKSLSRLTSKVGLKKYLNGYVFFILLIPRFFSRLKEYLIKTNLEKHKGIADWKAPSIVNKIIVFILCIDSNILYKLYKHLRIIIPGLTVYYVGKRDFK